MTTMFAVGRDDLRRTQWRDTPPAPLRPGEARLRIDLFALTANNITYGAFGEAMHYWDFFPTGDAGTGCIPVWGFATVSESLVEGVDVGERFYGYWPMADEVGPRAGARHRRGILRRRAAPSRAARGLQPLPALQQRPGVPAPSTRRCARCCGRSSSPRS